MPTLRKVMTHPRFNSLSLEDQSEAMRRVGASEDVIEKWRVRDSPLPAPPSRLQAPGPGASLGQIMNWRQGAMGDLGRAEPQTPEETAAAASGAGSGLTIGAAAATAPQTLPGLVKGGGYLAGSLWMGNYLEKKLGLPWWMGEAFAIVVQKKPRGVAGRAVSKFRQWMQRGAKGGEKELVEEITGAVTKEATRGKSRNMGTTSRTTNLPDPGLPANATLTRIPTAPKRPGIPRRMGGTKAQTAWRESVGLRPGAMGPDDVLAMRARGATQEEIEAALLRAARPSKTWGTPTPKVGEKPANWKPAGPTSRPRPKKTDGPKIKGGSAGEATLSEILSSVKAWKTTQKLSKPQIESALREVYGIPRTEAREIYTLMAGG